MAANGFSTIFLSEAMTGFSSILAPITAFSFAVANDYSTLGDVIKVPYITNTSASGLFDYVTGYTGDGTLVTAKSVTLGTLLYQRTTIDDASWSKLQGANIQTVAQTMGRRLAADVLSASFSAILTETNFPTSASITQDQLSSSVGWSSLVNQADSANWTVQRSAILSPSAWQYALRNPDISTAFSYGSNVPITTGNIPFVFGFNCHKYSSPFPPTAQTTRGLICDPSSIVLGIGLHKPSEASKGLVSVEEITNDTGLKLQLKTWYDPDHASTIYSIECLTGVTLGNPTGLVKLK